jgi:hypothetical protein
MTKDTGCKACDEQQGTELCPMHRLEMISAQITYWTDRACETLKEIQIRKEQT